MRVFAVAVALACACGGGGGGGGSKPDADTDTTDPNVPPQGDFDAMMTWLGSASYKTWTCEPSPHPQEFPSNHGYNRTCNNPILHAAAVASQVDPFPVDAASVKELYDDCGLNIIGMAVSLKVDATTDAWYWYQTGGSPSKMEEGTGPEVNDCVGCHQQAGRDFTFAIVMAGSN